MAAQTRQTAESPPLSHGFLTVGIWTLASRALGFARDVVFAALLGSGPVAEAFLIAFSLPNMFRRIFAEGAFNTAFVPMYAKKLESNGDAGGFADEALAGLVFVLILLTLTAQLAMPALVIAMASGFIGDERFDIAVQFGRIVFPYVLFISLAALISGMLNAASRFAAAAAAPTLLNILFIAAMIVADKLGLAIGQTLAWTAPVAGVAQLMLVYFALRRAGFSLRLRWPKFSPQIKRLAIIAAPAALAGGVVQVNLLIGRQVASVFDGAVAWLNYADRLYQLPLGVVGIAIGIVLLPELSKRLAADDNVGAIEAYSRSAEAALALAIPASVALAIIPLPMIHVLFERGNFTSADTVATATALAIYAAGLPAFVLQKVVQSQFFARHDTRTPFLCALAAMVINASIAIVLATSMGYLSAALGATLAGWGLLILLLWRSRSIGHTTAFDRRFKAALPKIMFAAAVMGIAIYFASHYSFRQVSGTSMRYLWLTGIIVGGATIYGSTLILLGGLKRQDIRRLLNK